MTTTRGFVAILAAMVACGDGTDAKETDSGADTETDTDTTDTTETGTPTTLTVYGACTADFDPEIATVAPKAAEGQRCKVGNAVVKAGSYVGTDETWLFPLIGPYEVGDVACALSYSLSVQAERNDCAWGGKDCAWAYDLVIADAAVEDPFGLCLETVGYDAATVKALNGTIVSRAFHDDYAGHAQVRMEYSEGAWTSVGYGDYDPVSGAFSFADLDGDAVPL